MLHEPALLGTRVLVFITLHSTGLAFVQALAVYGSQNVVDVRHDTGYSSMLWKFRHVSFPVT